MKSYSFVPEDESKYAFARLERVDASFKDLCEVCGRIKGLKSENALSLLEDFASGKKPVLYKRHNKKMGHRKELGGKKGRYPMKESKIVLGVLKSALANASVKGLLHPLVIVHASANKCASYPRLASKGRRSRSYYELARVEIVLRGEKLEALEKPKEEKGDALNESAKNEKKSVENKNQKKKVSETSKDKQEEKKSEEKKEVKKRTNDKHKSTTKKPTEKKKAKGDSKK